MNLCQNHWERLREKIAERDLAHLVASDGVTAAAQLRDQAAKLEGRDEITPANFDPLMGAFWAIGSNVVGILSNAGGNPLYLLGTGPEDPVEGYGPEGDGRTWPRCGLCYLGLVHELTCHERRCSLPKVDGYGWMLDRAADEAKAKASELGLVA